MSYRLDGEIGPAQAHAVEELLAVAPNAHFTQHPGWTRILPPEPGETWRLFTGHEGGALAAAGLVRLRKVPLLGDTVADVFRGPAAVSADAFLRAVPALERLLAAHSPMAVRIDPYFTGGDAERVREGLAELGYRPMRNGPWHMGTLEVDIDRPPDALLRSFHESTRRHVKKARRLPIELREDLDDDGLARFCAVYAEMSARKGAAGRAPEFLRGLRDFCRVHPERGFILSSWMEGQLLSAIVVFTIGARAVYAWGASTGRGADGREVPKSHLLHFEAMQRARARGCVRYDLGGFADGAGNDTASTSTQKVNFFKRGFGGKELAFGPPFERVRSPLRYHAIRLARRLVPERVSAR